MFNILLFSLLAVLLVVAGITAMSRNRARPTSSTAHPANGASRRNRKAKRAQSRADRRKRH